MCDVSQVLGGDPLPTGIVQLGEDLTWRHRLEYTDSDDYECRVMDPASGRVKVVSVKVTVIRK